MTAVDVWQGSGPVIFAAPHASIVTPHPVVDGLNAVGLALADTDWHVDELHEGLLANATFVRARFHRYVIDANRDPSGESLYPGQFTTALCPTTDFEGAAIHLEGAAPDALEIARRVESYHRPYHAALDAEIARVREAHGVALVYDCHSIRSRLPKLFEGELPALNIGTNGGETCAPELEAIVAEAAERSDFSSVVNGRFKGGWTTRRVGRPAAGVHAIQMEIAQRSYLEAEEAPWSYDEGKAGRLRAVLRPMLHRLEEAVLASARG